MVPKIANAARSRELPEKEMQALTRAIRAAAGPQLEHVECIDVFAGKGIAADRRSIAISMAFRASDRTLASEEVAAAVEQVISQLASSFSAELRGS